MSTHVTREKYRSVHRALSVIDASMSSVTGGHHSGGIRVKSIARASPRGGSGGDTRIY